MLNTFNMDEVHSSSPNAFEAKLTESNIVTPTYVLSVTALIILITWCAQFSWRRRRLYKFASQIQGPLALPFIGSSMYFVGNDMLQSMMRMFDSYKGVFKLWMGVKLFYVVSEPKHFEILFKKCLEKDSTYLKGNLVIKLGLLTARLPEWRVHRKMIAPTFNQQILDSFVEVFSEKSEVLVDVLGKYSGKGEFDVFGVVARCSLDFICETAMGIKSTMQLEGSDLFEKIDRLTEIMFLRAFVPWYYSDFLFKLLPLGKEACELYKGVLDFTAKVIEDKKKEHEETPKYEHFEEQRKRKAFLDHLLEATNDEKKGFTEEELQEEVFILIVAGTDTSASTICFALIMLGLHQELQNKVYDEIMEVIGPDRQPEVTDLPKLKYLERFIKETLRLFPVAAIVARAAEEDIDIGDCIIPAGASIIFNILKIHRDKKNWPDPYKFDPDRFLPEEVAKRHPCTYVPFTYGPRNCIGMKYAMMNMETVIASVVRRYRIFTSYKNIEDIKLKLHTVLRPKDGYKVSIQARNIE